MINSKNLTVVMVFDWMDEKGLNKVIKDFKVVA